VLITAVSTEGVIEVDVANASELLANALAEHKLPATTINLAPNQVEATVRVPAGRVEEALQTAVALWTKAVADVGLPEWPVVRADVATYDVRRRQAERPAIPELVGEQEIDRRLEDLLGTAEVATRLAVAKPRVSALSKDP